MLGNLHADDFIYNRIFCNMVFFCLQITEMKKQNTLHSDDETTISCTQNGRCIFDEIWIVLDVKLSKLLSAGHLFVLSAVFLAAVSRAPLCALHFCRFAAVTSFTFSSIRCRASKNNSAHAIWGVFQQYGFRIFRSWMGSIVLKRMRRTFYVQPGVVAALYVRRTLQSKWDNRNANQK